METVHRKKGFSQLPRSFCQTITFRAIFTPRRFKRIIYKVHPHCWLTSFVYLDSHDKQGNRSSGTSFRTILVIGSRSRLLQVGLCALRVPFLCLRRNGFSICRSTQQKAVLANHGTHCLFSIRLEMQTFVACSCNKSDASKVFLMDKPPLLRSPWCSLLLVMSVGFLYSGSVRALNVTDHTTF